MLKSLARIIILFTLITLVSACGPAATPSASPTIAPNTATPLRATVVATSAPTTPTPTATLEPGLAAEIDTYLRSLEEEDAFSGAVLVARGGHVLLSRGYGLANREENIPNTPQTKFRLCSITKQFTAMGILILQNQGALDVQDHLM